MKPIQQHSFNTTMMGALMGVVDYYKLSVTASDLFALSGHGFMLNVHEELCPSGPYVWNYERYLELLQNLGLKLVHLGYADGSTPAAERQGLEQQVREALAAGIPCFLINMENQLITGTDETGFSLGEPWEDGCEYSPPHLTFETWDEFGSEVHVCFYRVEQCEPASVAARLRDSLAYAVSLYEDPKRYAYEGYGIGPDAWRNWESAVQHGHGSHHGNWWNGRVWSECRQMVGHWFTRLADQSGMPRDLIKNLAAGYDRVGALLLQISDKELPTDEKLKLIREAAALEESNIARLSELLRTVS